MKMSFKFCAIVLILIFVNIYNCSGDTKTSICGDALYVTCKPKYYMEITKAMWSIRKQPTKDDEKKDLLDFMRAHADVTKEAQILCHNVNTCSAELAKSGPLPPFLEEINKQKLISSGNPTRNQYLSIKFEFNCFLGQCPHPKFVEKHIIKSGTTAPRFAKIAEVKRKQYGQQPTNFMSLFNNAENMEYVRDAHNICLFKHDAEKYDCIKSGLNWNCKRNGREIAKHDPKIEGHYLPSQHHLLNANIEGVVVDETIITDNENLAVVTNPTEKLEKTIVTDDVVLSADTNPAEKVDIKIVTDVPNSARVTVVAEQLEKTIDTDEADLAVVTNSTDRIDEPAIAA